jgi:zinc protease
MWAVWACGCGPANNAAPAPQQVHAPANAAMPAAVVKTAEPGLTVEVLGNGLTVIVRENHSSPVVVVQSFVRAGSMYEGKYLGCGISHLVEHLVAEGAESGAAASGAAKARASRIDKIGGQSNAFTGMENTAYYIAAAAGRADECIDLVADWMARPSITQADFDREHGVVTRELEMGLDDPDRQLWYAHQANMYGTHPAGIPTIGYKAPLAALTLQDVLDYHGRMYVPQNMVFVVVGDVDTAKVLARIQKSFAATAPGRRFDYVLPEVEPVAAPRRVEVSSKLVKETLEVMAFQTIPLVHEDLYALDVLSYILSNGDASRLARTVKRQARLVTNISSSSWTPAWGKGSFEIEFHCAPDKPDQAEKAILAELATVAGAKVSDEELSRAKRQKVSDQVYTQQTVESQAGTLGGDLLSTNDVNFSKHYTDRIQQVTAEQVQAVAKKYLDPARVVITRLAPEATSAATTTAPTSRPSTRPEATLFKLPNGLRVVLYPTPTVDLVSMVLTTRGGLLLETDKTNGMGSLMTALSTCGAGTLSAEDIASFFDDAGGAVTAICGNNTFLYTATVL